jgi:patatin-like phospholipase/acyl hydrolase
MQRKGHILGPTRNSQETQNAQTMRVVVLDGGATKCVYQYALMQYIVASHPSQIDLLVGVSGGAIVAALTAYNLLDALDMRTQLPKMFDVRNPLGPIMAPMYSGTGKTRLLQDVFGDRELKDAAVPIAILATSMRDGAPILFTSWTHPTMKIAEVLDASTAAPVFFPPILVKEFGFLIDGGISSNVPILNAYIAAKERNGGSSEGIRMLSIGCNMRHDFKNIDHVFAQKMGGMSWLSHGLLDMLLGVGNDTCQRIIIDLLGNNSENFLRVTANLEGGFMMPSKSQHAALLKRADELWNEHKVGIHSILS